MARRKQNTTVENKIAYAMEQGKPVKRLRGFIALENHNSESGIWLEVEAIKTVVQNCGVKILIKPVAGIGEAIISPSEWFDSAPDIIANKAKEEAIVKAEGQFKHIYTDPLYVADKRERLDTYIRIELTKAQQKAFLENTREEFGHDDIKKHPKRTIHQLTKTAVLVGNGLTQDEINEYHFRD